MIIFKVKDFREEWFEGVPNVPQNLLFGKSPNGWTDRKISLRWLEANFGPSSITADKAGARYRILLFNGHNSHVNISFLECCINNKVIPICLPPHTSHHLQPLDVSVFSAYKHAYHTELQERFESHDRGVGKHNFYQIISKVWPIALTPENIRSGFRYAGIIPSDGTIILDQLRNEQNAKDERISHNNTTISPTRKLSDLEISEVFNIHTPQKPHQLTNQVNTILQDMPPSSPSNWRRCPLMKRIIHCAEREMVDNSMKQQRIESLENELHDLCNKKKQSRKIIPDHGASFLSRDEIVEFFEQQEAEKS
ncbi:DDE-domain-containing protein [Choiromyces venosus 120613-1]|uniref:DDE-domain-containing protein n=1 Tax=Choiromyces venosus 120613-1 TaxID=1336337 RepID=A0A3N4JSN2_9PEZI|nr:DDE-domain-containing protein [Choiromyces venosus 120613-1]